MKNIQLKWKRAKNGQTESTCRRYWFGDNPVSSGVKLWHEDTDTLVGEFPDSKAAKDAAQRHFNRLGKYFAMLEVGRRNADKKRAEMALLPKTISPGDLFIFLQRKPVHVDWCVVASDQDLWFVVPRDHQCPLVGTRDVEVPGSSMILRCGCGLWIHADDFDFELRTGQISMRHIENVRDRLAQIVGDRLPTTESHLETDRDPEYIEWIEELSAAADGLEWELRYDDEV